MQFHDLTLPKVLALAILATLLGVAVLEADSARRGAMTSTPAVATAAAATPAAPGTLAAANGQAASDPADTPPTPQGDPAPTPEPVVEAPALQRRGGVVCSQPHRLVQVPRDGVIRARPGGRSIGELPARSVYLGQSMTAWVQEVSADGRWGKVTLPWSKPVGRAGWVSLAGMQGRATRTMVVADLSERRLRVYRGCQELFSVPTAIGRPGSPSPRGRFWVTDRVAVPGAQQASFGTFAFGLSTVQPNLPAGWTGGDQMAIHGTGAPGSIGEAASAGCLRVSEEALARLRPILRGGTPVIITA